MTDLTLTGPFIVILILIACCAWGAVAILMHIGHRREERRRRLNKMVSLLREYKLMLLGEIVEDLVVSDWSGAINDTIQLVKQVEQGEKVFLEMLKPSWVAQLAERVKDPECVLAFENALDALKNAKAKDAAQTLATAEKK